MIEVKHLTKKYGSFTAVNDISFTVEKGRIYGFLGPNGAGKSTTMNIITGCLAATSGEVCVNGHDIYEEPVEAKASVGYLPEIPPLYTDMTPEEFLMFVGEAKQLEPTHLDVRVEEVMRKTGLLPVRGRLIRNLSKGYRQRVGIAQAILGDPEIVILDEPTVGLDPLQIIEIRELIKALGQEHTVILSSHILSEISAVCDYIIIISHGRIVASDTIEHLTASVDGHRIITLDVRGELSAVTDALAELQGAVNTSVSYGLGGCVRVSIETPSERDMREEVFRLFAAKDLPIVEMSTNDASLEDVFLRLTEESAPTPDGETPSEDGTDGKDDSGEDAADADSPYYGDDDNSDSKETPQDDYKPLFGGKQ
ncbi:MAG: ABC transporter ATP-binding protein [Eubacteriales bacterium]